MRILVTGATGFVGRALCQHLLRLDCRVRAVTSSADAQYRLLVASPSREGLEVVRVGHEAYDPADWAEACDGIDFVIHLGARAHVLKEIAGDVEAVYQRANCEITLALASAACKSGVRRFVFISSIGVNGAATGNFPFDADSPCEPHSPYARSKYAAELGLQRLALNNDLEVVIIRPPLVYGADAPGNFGTLMRAVRSGWPLPLGAVHNLRSLVALDNLVDFIVTCKTHPQAANQTFLISDGHDLSTAELIRGLAHAAGVPARLVPVPLWLLQVGAALLGKGDAVQRLCGNLQVDISKARSLLGWVPPVSVDEGLRRAVAG